MYFSSVLLLTMQHDKNQSFPSISKSENCHAVCFTKVAKKSVNTLYTVFRIANYTRVPILSSKEGPLYHFNSRGSLQGPTRFSPVRPLQGTYTTSESCKRERERNSTDTWTKPENNGNFFSCAADAEIVRKNSLLLEFTGCF